MNIKQSLYSRSDWYLVIMQNFVDIDMCVPYVLMIRRPRQDERSILLMVHEPIPLESVPMKAAPGQLLCVAVGAAAVAAVVVGVVEQASYDVSIVLGGQSLARKTAASVPHHRHPTKTKTFLIRSLRGGVSGIVNKKAKPTKTARAFSALLYVRRQGTPSGEWNLKVGTTKPECWGCTVWHGVWVGAG